MLFPRHYGIAMDDRSALLAAIVAAPDDDAPRLVYADWLDEHGDPDRAEFIRHQIETQNSGGTWDWYAGRTAKENRMLGSCRDKWLHDDFGGAYPADLPA